MSVIPSTFHFLACYEEVNRLRKKECDKMPLEQAHSGHFQIVSKLSNEQKKFSSDPFIPVSWYQHHLAVPSPE